MVQGNNYDIQSVLSGKQNGKDRGNWRVSGLSGVKAEGDEGLQDGLFFLPWAPG